jgi:hypothetical protein
MIVGWILLILLLLFFVGTLPVWPYARGRWGYGPSAVLGLLLVLMIVTMFLRTA